MTEHTPATPLEFEEKKKIRYAVVGLGYIAQVAVLPAFRNSGENTELTALVSGDAEKLDKLGKKYGVKQTYSYEQYDACLRSGQIDAVYIALPNSLHREFTVRAAKAGIHVLCEKPLAVTEAECEEMIRACRDNKVKLMTAYRLHFEEANLKAIELLNSGKIGKPRLFQSLFTMQVKEGDIRLQSDLGGGTLYDIGIYCINAARAIFRSEPYEVFAETANTGEERFREVDEMTSAVLRFSEERLATFTTSFGSSDISSYRVVGPNGDLQVEPAYEYAEELEHRLTINGKTEKQKFSKKDQFAPELVYFSNCILKDKEPEPSGIEGLADVRVIRALYRSAQTGKPVPLGRFEKDERPGISQEMQKPAVKKPDLVNASSPHPE